MTDSRWLKLLAASMSLVVPACVADSAAAPEDNAPAPNATVVHMMPIHSPSQAAGSLKTDPAPIETATADLAPPPPATPHLTYWGGPLLTNVVVHSVWWNSASRFAPNFAQFYPSVVASPLYSMLSQYGIGFGSATPQFLDNRPTASVTDAQVQSELTRLINNRLVPPPAANCYYPIHFPQGMKITAPDGSQSCVQFCAYHGTYVLNGVNVNYGVIPDVGDPGCNGGCGGNTVLNNEFSVASHELVEATTDPAVGLATVFGPPLGWYDPNFGEIGDICNGIQGTTNGFVVQKEWSNAVNACVDH